MEIIEKYFDKEQLTDKQIEQFEQLKELYSTWNEQINVISRKDLDNFYERHVLHSLAIAKVIQFKPKTRVLDIGTGGGFPGIPLAILFPEVEFVLVDSIAKKIKVVQEVAKALELNNVTAINDRAEKVKDQFDFIVSRAVTRLVKFLPWTKGKITRNNFNDLNNGILYLKGGDLEEELKESKRRYKLFETSNSFSEEFFETKKVVYIPNL